MDQIIHTINKKNYVLFEVEVPISRTTKWEDKINRYSGITQSITKKESFWNGTTINIKILIPEENAMDFSND